MSSRNKRGSLKPPEDSAATIRKINELLAKVKECVDTCTNNKLCDEEAKEMEDTLRSLYPHARNPSLKAMIASKVVVLTVSIYRIFLKYEETLQVACDLVWALSYHDPNIQAQFAHVNCCTYIIEAMEYYSVSVPFLKSAIGAISSLCRHPLNQNIAKKSQVADVLCRILDSQSLQDVTLLQYVLDASASICHSHKENTTAFLGNGGTSLVLALLKEHMDNEGIVKATCVLCAVLRSRPAGQEKMVKAGAIPLFITCLSVHSTSPELTHVLCAIIGQMIRDYPDLYTQVINSGGIEILLTVLSNHPHHKLTIELSCSILLLCCNPKVVDYATKKILEDKLLMVDWSPLGKLLEPLASPTEAVQNTYRLGVLRVVIDFCTILESKSLAKLVSNGLIYLFVGSSNQVSKADSSNFQTLLSSFLASKTFSTFIKLTDSWIEAILQPNAIEDSLKYFDVVTLMDNNVDEYLEWYEATGYDEYFVRSTMKGTMTRLETLEIDRREGRALRDPLKVGELHSLYTTIAGLMLSTSHASPRAPPTQLNAENVLSELIGNAQVWLQELKEFPFDTSDASLFVDSVWTVIAICRFLIVAMYSDRQLSLRCLANNGGVSIFLAIRRVLTQLDPEVISSEPACWQAVQRLEQSISEILQLVGATTATTMPSIPSRAHFRDRFLSVCKERRIAAKFSSGASANAAKKLDTEDSENDEEAEKDKVDDSKDESDGDDSDGSDDEVDLDTLFQKDSSSDVVDETRPNFAASLPDLIYDIDEDDLEPFSNPQFSAPGHSVSTPRQLVYDWVLANGMGHGKARSRIAPVKINDPKLEGMQPLQNTSLPSFLAGGPKEHQSREHHLLFESRFESGNLLQAYKTGPLEYDLLIRSDIHTRRHHQWFYFAVTNTHAFNSQSRVSYRFNIVNHSKPGSMFSEGMRPCLYSFHRADTKGEGWRRRGTNIVYHPTYLEDERIRYHTLSFTMSFDTPNDIYLLAMCYPYTYTKLCRFLNVLCSPETESIVRREKHCDTLSGLPCEMLTITNHSSKPAEIKSRHAVVFSGRIHPGETNASFMMEGTIKFLTGDSALAKMLRQLYVFKVIPMLNPDGVYYGNYRTSLTGQDLNRCWGLATPNHHPTIFYAKQLILQLQMTHGVALYVDFHGHSRKRNIFLYGCDPKQLAALGVAAGMQGMGPKYIAKQFAQLVADSKFSDFLFSYDYCSFKVSRSHVQTARVVVARELGVPGSFTLEASFAGGGEGTNNSKLHDMHFNPTHFGCMGAGLCEALAKLYHPALFEALALRVPDVSKCTIEDADLVQMVHPVVEAPVKRKPQKGASTYQRMKASLPTSGGAYRQVNGAMAGESDDVEENETNQNRSKGNETVRPRFVKRTVQKADTGPIVRMSSSAPWNDKFISPNIIENSTGTSVTGPGPMMAAPMNPNLVLRPPDDEFSMLNVQSSTRLPQLVNTANRPSPHPSGVQILAAQGNAVNGPKQVQSQNATRVTSAKMNMPSFSSLAGAHW